MARTAVTGISPDRRSSSPKADSLETPNLRRFIQPGTEPRGHLFGMRGFGGGRQTRRWPRLLRSGRYRRVASDETPVHQRLVSVQTIACLLYAPSEPRRCRSLNWYRPQKRSYSDPEPSLYKEPDRRE